MLAESMRINYKFSKLLSSFPPQAAHNLCATLRTMPHPTLADINDTIQANVVSLLLPKTSVASSPRPVSLARDIAHLCPHPAYRFLDVKTAPQVG